MQSDKIFEIPAFVLHTPGFQTKCYLGFFSPKTKKFVFGNIYAAREKHNVLVDSKWQVIYEAIVELKSATSLFSKSDGALYVASAWVKLTPEELQEIAETFLPVNEHTTLFDWWARLLKKMGYKLK